MAESVQIQRTSKGFTMSFTAEHFASREARTQKNISLAGLIVWCIATTSVLIHQRLYKAITQQVKNLVIFRGWGFSACFLLLPVQLFGVKTVNLFPVYLSVFVFIYPCLFLILITVYFPFSLSYFLHQYFHLFLFLYQFWHNFT